MTFLYYALPFVWWSTYQSFSAKHRIRDGTYLAVLILVCLQYPYHYAFATSPLVGAIIYTLSLHLPGLFLKRKLVWSLSNIVRGFVLEYCLLNLPHPIYATLGAFAWAVSIHECASLS